MKKPTTIKFTIECFESLNTIDPGDEDLIYKTVYKPTWGVGTSPTQPDDLMDDVYYDLKDIFMRLLVEIQIAKRFDEK